jgi:hypothetical protein
MRLGFLIPPLFALAACAGPQAVPADAAAPSGADAIERKFDPEGMVLRNIREEDVGAFFTFLRQSLDAAAEGKKPPELPPDLAKRAEEIGRQMKHEGTEASRILLDEMEREMREMLREQRSGD